MLSLSTEEAARFLVTYHLTPTDIAGVFDRLGSVQYDPLNPVGRNPDLVFQARAPGYRVDDWQVAAYHDRIVYDAWDKQACLVPMADWPFRALIRQRYHPWHDHLVLEEFPDAAPAALAELDARGPLSSLEFEERRQIQGRHSWLGQTLIKRVLRALWVRGEIVTHHREGARHYYDRAERVVPAEHFQSPMVTEPDAYHRWVILRRHQAAGMLRPKGSAAEIWSVCGNAEARQQAINELVDAGDLVSAEVGPRKLLFHLPASAIPWLERQPDPYRMVFLAPLDNLLWDRKAIQYLFGFDYAWEVYKKEHLRRWGYYVLPVLYADRFVARFESRLENGTWNVLKWWWEDGIEPDADILAALTEAAAQFRQYLSARRVRVAGEIDVRARRALAGG